MSTGDNSAKACGEAAPGYLILDTESVPDGKLLSLVKYAGEYLTPDEAIAQAQAEARELSASGSDFLPVTFQYPVAVCVARVGSDFKLQAITCLDAPQFRTREIVEAFWRGTAHYSKARLVTFNGRGFDLPLLELAAFRYGCDACDHFRGNRHRFTGHLDLMDWMSNFGGYRMAGGLNILSKLLGNPGKMQIKGDQVYLMHRAGKIQEINDYCMFDTLDTYFVFLRTRILTGEITLDQEKELVAASKSWMETKVSDLPALRHYLDSWGDWTPWP